MPRGRETYAGHGGLGACAYPGNRREYDHGEFDWGMVLDETISQDENSIAEASISLF